MLEVDPLQLGVLLLGGIAVAGIAYALAYPFLSGERKVEKRLAEVTESKTKRIVRTAQAEQITNRRKAVSDTIKELENREKAKKKVSLRLQLQRAGLDISPNAYWAASAICGVVLGLALFIFMPHTPPVVLAVVVFIGGLGVPRWVLKQITKRRQTKFVDEFANSIDIIVRGVKSGLPLNECLGIIAREAQPPIREEFTELVEQQRVGVTLAEGFDKMMARMPLPEVKFFGIVIAIQQQAGGNLSEALGNLSGVLRDRKLLKGKVSALSAEAKASAMVLGCLPFLVMTMVYVTTPNYIALLYNTNVGVFLLCCAGVWMTLGILVMRKMINFKY